MTADSFAKVLAAATLLAGLPAPVFAQNLRCDRGEVEVRGLEFTGNATFSSTELADVIVTTPSGLARRRLNLPFSSKRCLDPDEFANDLIRLRLFYRQRGFSEVAVDTARTPAGLGGVRVRFIINEGRPTILNTLVIAGIDSMPRRAAIVRDLPLRVGQRFDRTLLTAAIDTITRRLRNAGYPSASATNVFLSRTGLDGPLADDSLTVVPGPLTRVGAVSVSVDPVPGRKPQVPMYITRRIARVDSGAVVREQALIDAQFALYQTEMYTHVLVAMDSANGKRVGTDSMVPVRIAVVENTTHAARVTAGYGTLDCFRASAELDDYNFLRRARRLELQGRVSKIGIGEPLDGASRLCPDARRDAYSGKLNYYLGTTLRQPFFFGLRTVPTITAYTSRVSEYNAFVRTTSIGAIASLSWQRSRRTLATFSYSLDYGRTEAQPALFCAVFNLCVQEDREPVQNNQRLAVVGIVVARNAANNAVSPTRGTMSRLELKHASPVVFSDRGLRFNTVLSDVAHYIPLGGGNVLALHVRSGFVFGSGFIPPQERMYAGGPTSVRGFRQNELGGATYLARSQDFRPVVAGADTLVEQVVDTVRSYRRVVPVGGNSLLVGNVEFRLRSPVLPDILQFALFADAGDVWNRGRSEFLQSFRIKVTPGVQLSALTPIGPVRVVVGYNPYKRPDGSLFYENATAFAGRLPCVSPPKVESPTQQGTLFPSKPTSCLPTFRPESRRSLRSQLTFGLAIGQAF